LRYKTAPAGVQQYAGQAIWSITWPYVSIRASPSWVVARRCSGIHVTFTPESIVSVHYRCSATGPA
jgi:hypothetical protein